MNHILSANRLRKCIKFSLENFMWKLNWGFNIRDCNFFVRWTWLSVGIDEIPFWKVNSNCFHVSVTLHTLNSIQDVFHMTSTILNLKHWSVHVKVFVHLKDADQYACYTMPINCSKSHGVTFCFIGFFPKKFWAFCYIFFGHY